MILQRIIYAGAKRPVMKYIGVDACSNGWFAGILNDGHLETHQYDSISALYDQHHEAAGILVDIPIGVPETERRACDEEARARLGCRGLSVFHPPCRAVVDENPDDYDRANVLNREITDDGLSQQAFHILPEIKEVDEFIEVVSDAGETVWESHPELCFYAFNDRNPIAYSKQSERGREKRRDVLRYELTGSDEAYESAMDEHYRKDVTRDDILDALVLTAAAQEDSLISIPDDRDHRQQRNVIVYPNPN